MLLNCYFKVKKIIPECGHSIIIPCKSVPEYKLCTLMCERDRDCGHKCKNVCGTECSAKKCKEIVLQKISELTCGHKKVMVLCCDKNNSNTFVIK